MDDSELRETVADGLETRAAFFAHHAGFGYFADAETPADGLRRTAEDLADAERFAESRGWFVGWEDDWSIGMPHAEFFGDAYGTEPETCETAVLFDENAEPLASLGCIDDADTEYRRVVAAELAAEAMGRFVRAITA